MLLATCAHHASVLIDVPRAGDGPPGQCTGGDGGLNIHGYFPASTGDLLPVTDIRPAMQGAAGAGIFELARDGMAVGHDASLSLSYEQLAAAGMQHRGLTERLCRAGQEVVRRHMPARCSDIRSPIQAGQPPYNAFYSNAVRVRGDLLERRPRRGRTREEERRPGSFAVCCSQALGKLSSPLQAVLFGVEAPREASI